MLFKSAQAPHFEWRDDAARRPEKLRAQEVSQMQSTLSEVSRLFEQFGSIVAQQVGSAAANLRCPWTLRSPNFCPLASRQKPFPVLTS